MAVIYSNKATLDGLRKRIPKDVYSTDPILADAVTKYVYENIIGGREKLKALDPGAGNGVWGEAIHRYWYDPSVTGVEIRNLIPKPGYKYWFAKTDFIEEDRVYDRFDLVIGNPPFNQAEAFIRKGISLLEKFGYLCFLLPSDFMHSQGRVRGLFQDHVPFHILHLAQRPNFLGPRGENLGNAQTDNFVIGIWGNNDNTDPTTTSFLDWRKDEEE